MEAVPIPMSEEQPVTQPVEPPASTMPEFLSEIESVAMNAALADHRNAAGLVERLKNEISRAHGLSEADTFNTVTRAINRGANLTKAPATT